MYEAPRLNPRTKNVLAWSLTGLAIIGAMLVALNSGASAGLAGYMMGRSLPLTGGIVVISLLIGRSLDADAGANVALAAGVLILGVQSWYAYQAVLVGEAERAVAEARPATHRIGQAAIAEIASISAGGIDAPASPDWQPYQTPATRVDLGDQSIALNLRIAELARRERVRQVELTRQSARASRDSGVEIIVDNARLLDADEREVALRQMQDYREYLDAFEQRLAELSRLFYADVSELGLSEYSERELKSSYNRKLDETITTARAMIEQEIAIVENVEKLVRLVAIHAEGVSSEGQILRFSDPTAQSEYDNLSVQLGLTEP